MRVEFYTYEFWAAMGLAVLIKLRASEWGGWAAAITSALVAILAAFVFTPAVVEYLEISSQRYFGAVAALVALTFEQIAREIMRSKILDMIKGKGAGK